MHSDLVINNGATYHKKIMLSVVAMAALWVVFLLPVPAFAQGETGKSVKLLVGTIDAPPFAMRAIDGNWQGLSADLWQAVASVLGVPYEIREFDTIDDLLGATEEKQIDVAIALAVTEQREIKLDLSQAYYRSGLAIAISKDRLKGGWLAVFGRLFHLDILKIIGILILLGLIAGTAVWIFENRRNQEMFGGGSTNGFGHAVWWAAVTMTTVGYGDKVPRTLGGRMVAIFWMMASIALISIFTASISASLTVERLTGKVRGPQDLPHVRVGSIDQPTLMDLLDQRGIAPIPFLNEQDGLKALVEGETDAFVYDELILKHLVKTDFPGRIHILPGTFEHYYISMGMPVDSPLREPINRALLKVMKKDKWTQIVNQYIGFNY